MAINQFDKEADEFNRNFSKYKNKKIVLYGIGRLTQTLLERIEEFQIIGLLDRDEMLIGQERYGLKILSRQEVEENADIVIINTVDIYWSIIYSRIKDWNITIFTRDGRVASDIMEQRYDEQLEINVTEIKNKIEKHEVISFDIFDTLLMRKIYNPEDVFVLVEQRLKKESGETFSYIEFRKRAFQLLEEPTISELFEKMGELSGWNAEKLEKIKTIEISVDRSLITARKEMVKLCNECLESKEVYFISDMYYPRDMLYHLLQENGVTVKKEQILVSCDLKKTKRYGEIWKYYKEEILDNRSALHIGDNVVADIENPKKYGIDTYQVLSAGAMLRHSALGKIVPEIKSIDASLYIGMLNEKMFNSPFALYQRQGRVDFGNSVIAGYCLFGGIVYSFSMWLLEMAKKEDIEQLVFLGRDGYFLIRAYMHVCKLVGEDIPSSVYMETSRRAFVLPIIETIEDIMEEINRIAYVGTVKEFLYDRFGIEAVGEVEDIKIEEVQAKKYSLEEAFGYYENCIINKAKEEKENYLKYIDSLQIKDKFAVVDTGYRGFIQNSLGKILQKKVKGFYFCADLSNENKFYEENMWACFQNDEKNGENANIFTKRQFIESYFTSPLGMLLHIDTEGKCVYEELLNNQKKFSIREEMFQGIILFIEEMIALRNEIEIHCNSDDRKFIDIVYGSMLENSFIVSKEMKESFYRDGLMSIRSEYPICQ